MIIDNTTFLFNNKKEVQAVVAAHDVLVSEQASEINEKITHTLTVRYTEKMNGARYFGMRDYENPDVFVMYKITQSSLDGDIYALEGIHTLFDDLKGRGGVIVDRRPYKEPVADVLESILEGTGWTVGTVDTQHTITSNYYFEERLAAFYDLLEKGNVEFEPVITYEKGRVVSQKVNIADAFGGDSGLWFEHGHNLVTIEKEEKTTDLYTAFIGRGRGVENDTGGFGRRLLFEDIEWKKSEGDPVDKPRGQNYVEIPEASALYGYEDGSPRIGHIEFDDIEDPEELLMQTYLHAVKESRPKVQFSATVMDTENVRRGDTVVIVRDKPRLRYKTRIFKVTRDFIRGKAKDMQFGDKLIYTQAARIKKQKEEREKDKRELRDDIRRETGNTGASRGDVVIARHGTNADMKRPEGGRTVHWQGIAQPSAQHSEDFDLWFKPIIPEDQIFRITEQSSNEAGDNGFIKNVRWDNIKHLEFNFGPEHGQANRLFSDMPHLDKIEHLDMAGAETAGGMFSGSYNVQRVIIENMQGVRNVAGMFDGATGIIELSLGGLGFANTEDVEDRTLDVTDTALAADALTKLAQSLAECSTSYRWIMKYRSNQYFDTSILTNKNWIAQPVIVQ